MNTDSEFPLPTDDENYNDMDSPFFMPIEDVSQTTNRVTVVSGKIKSGRVKISDEVEIVGRRDTRKATVQGTQMFNRDVPEAVAGFTASILLRGINKHDIDRGMILAKPGSIKPLDMDADI